MSGLQQALQEVGYQPTPHVRLRTLRREAEREAKTSPITIETFGDGVEPISKPRKVVVTEQGGYFRARYAGTAVSTFGPTAKEATHALKFLSKDGR